jgi:hypothetical protein
VGKWKKDAKEFAVGVNYVEDRGYSSSIPKPVMDKLGRPESIKFVMNEEDNSIQLVSVSSHIFKSERVKSKHGN